MRRGLDVTRIVPAWDSGGSSKAIRERLGMLSVGDIRNALMSLAHGESRAGDVVRVFNTRLSDTDDLTVPQRELGFYLDGLHPALQAMAPGLREPILRYLKRFGSDAGEEFDLRRGSLGNLVLTGAYLAHGRDINAAISAFRELCSIRGHVWPVSTDNDLLLEATLRNGEVVREQHKITALDAVRAMIGIRELRLVRAGGGQPSANDAVLNALAGTDAIVFGPGSFYTSVLPHVMVGGIAQAIAARNAIPRIFVGNMLECPETVGVSLNRMLDEFFKYSSITHVLANQSPTPFQRSVGGRRYIAFDARSPMLQLHGVRALSRDFEDPWQRGMHEASLVASVIAELSSG